MISVLSAVFIIGHALSDSLVVALPDLGVHVKSAILFYTDYSIIKCYEEVKNKPMPHG